MNCKRALALFVTIVILLLGTSQVTGQQDGPHSPQGTYGYAFTYQGQLKDAGGPVNNTCDLRFILWDAASGGSQVGNTLTLQGVEIEDGRSPPGSTLAASTTAQPAGWRLRCAARQAVAATSPSARARS